MKRSLIVSAIAVLAIFAAAVSFTACTKSTDVVKDIDPMVAPGMDVIHLVNDKLHNAKNPAEMKQILNENPWVAPRVVTFARNLGLIPQGAKVDSVVFCWGSQEAQAQDKTKKWFSGHFTDQLVAFIFHDGLPKPTGVIVMCTNGVITSLDGLTRIGTQPITFTIERGKGINTYVDYQTAIMLAESFDLPLYKGSSISTGKKITPDEARKLEHSLGENKVTVLVYTGDHFDLGKMTYSPGRN